MILFLAGTFWFLVSLTGVVGLLITPAVIFANLFFFRRRPDAGRPPFGGLTMIVPLRGAEPHLHANLVSHVDCPPPVAFQLLIAMETADDPSYPTAREVQGLRPASDIEIVLTGDSVSRMGKVHNMMGAFAKAKHEVIAFADGDVRIEPGIYDAALSALASAPAAFLPPVYGRASDLGGAVVANLCNAFYFPLLAALDLFARVDFAGGGFMAFRRKALDDLGGPAAVADRMADDAALGRAVSRQGGRVRVVQKRLSSPSSPAPLSSVFRQLRRWSITIRSFLGGRYGLFPPGFVLSNAVLLVIVAVAAGKATPDFWSFIAALVAMRAAYGVVFASGLGRFRPGWREVLLFPVMDVLALPVWFMGLFGRKVSWRGRVYDVSRDGRVIGLPAP